MSVVVRQIETAEDYEAIARLRYEVYVEEMGKQPTHADHVTRQLRDEIDPVSVIFGAFDGDRAVATGRITRISELAPDSMWRTFYETDQVPVSDDKKVMYQRLMVRSEYRGSAVMAQLLKNAYEAFRVEGTEFGFMHCTPSLTPIYEMVGCRRYKKGQLDPEMGFRLPMVQLLGDVQHFATIRSPILSSVEKYPASNSLRSWFIERFPQYVAPASLRLNADTDLFGQLTCEPAQESNFLFAGLAGDDKKRITRASTLADVHAGDIILRQGDIGTELYLILDGEVEVSVSIGDRHRVLAKLGKGQHFGECGFLARTPRTANVRALSDLKILSISAENFDKVGNKYPLVGLTVVKNLGKALCRQLHSSAE